MNATPTIATARHRRIICATAIVATGALMFSSVVPAAFGSKDDTGSNSTPADTVAVAAGNTADGTVNKDEIVYVKTAVDGSTDGVYVVNKFDSGKAVKVSDPANYTKVTNLTTKTKLHEKNGAVTVNTMADKPFYYQGDMAADTTLPWTINVSYTLDGRKVEAKELAGKSGDLDIILTITPNTKDDKVSDFANSYVIQAQGTFPASAYRIDDAGDATLAASGDNTIVSAMVLPGETKTFRISGQARDFSSDGWQIAAMDLNMAIELKNEDTSELDGQTGELKDGASQLADGASRLSSGSSQLAGGSGQMVAGAKSLADANAAIFGGATNLSSGLAELNTGAQQLQTAIGQVQAGSDQYRSGLESARQQAQQQAQTAAAQVSEAQQALQSAMQAAMANPQDAAAQSNMNAALEAFAKANQAAGAAAGIAQTLDGTLDNYAALADGITGVNQGAQSLSQAAGQANDGARQLASAAGQASEGANSLTDGAASLHDDVISLASGADSLASATSQLTDSVQGMDTKVLDGLQKAIDKKMGGDFKPHSFVNAGNTKVNRVQFAYVVEGIGE